MENVFAIKFELAVVSTMILVQVASAIRSIVKSILANILEPLARLTDQDSHSEMNASATKVGRNLVGIADISMRKNTAGYLT